MTAPRIVPPAEAERIKDAARVSVADQAGGAPLAALLSGQMLHYPDTRTRFNAKRLREDHGRKLRTRNDGKGGRFYWLEAETPQDQPRRDVR